MTDALLHIVRKRVGHIMKVKRVTQPTDAEYPLDCAHEANSAMMDNYKWDKDQNSLLCPYFKK